MLRGTHFRKIWVNLRQIGNALRSDSQRHLCVNRLLITSGMADMFLKLNTLGVIGVILRHDCLVSIGSNPGPV